MTLSLTIGNHQANQFLLEIENSKTPTIAFTWFESSHSRGWCYCSPNTPSISLTWFESSHSERQYYCSPNTPTISLTWFKVCIQEDDATAHQTSQQSLSPDSKVHIQEDDAAAQQKCRQSLSPNSKACIQETKVIDIDQTTEEFLRENFYKHSTLPLVYYHCCSIDPRALTRLIRSIRLSDSLSNTF